MRISCDVVTVLNAIMTLADDKLYIMIICALVGENLGEIEFAI